MDYKSDIAKYSEGPINDKAVDAIVKFCGIALQSRDASRSLAVSFHSSK